MAVLVFSTRLQELVGERSAADLAQSAGMGLGTVRKLLAGESDPRLSTMILLAREFGLHSIEELLGPFGTRSALPEEATAHSNEDS